MIILSKLNRNYDKQFISYLIDCIYDWMFDNLNDKKLELLTAVAQFTYNKKIDLKDICFQAIKRCKIRQDLSGYTIFVDDKFIVNGIKLNTLFKYINNGIFGVAGYPIVFEMSKQFTNSYIDSLYEAYKFEQVFNEGYL